MDGKGESWGVRGQWGMDTRASGKRYPGLELLQCEGEDRGEERSEQGPPGPLRSSPCPAILLSGADSHWRNHVFHVCPCLLQRKLLRSMDFEIFLFLVACPLAHSRPSIDMRGMRK